MSVLNFSVRSLKYVSRINKFVAIGNQGDRVFYSFSEDLINWSERQILRGIGEETLPDTAGRTDKKRREIPQKTYFSILDSTSKSVNFDTVENEPYLYFVERRNNGSLRDIFRIPIEFISK